MNYIVKYNINPDDGILTNVYWFNVNDTIQKYKEIYEPYINTNTKRI